MIPLFLAKYFYKQSIENGLSSPAGQVFNELELFLSKFAILYNNFDQKFIIMFAKKLHFTCHN